MNNWKVNYQQIPVSDLHLDLKNPRTNTGEKQGKKSVEQELLDENIVELIESISSKGYAAASVTMVVQERGKNITIDGNRRLFAVKVLENPDMIREFVPSMVSNAEFEKIKDFAKKKKELISTLTAIVYPSRDEAEKEMSILHLDGEAVKKWKPLRQYRYFQDRIRKEKQGISNFAESLGISVDRVKRGLITIQLYQESKESIDLGDLSQEVFNEKKFRTDKFQKTVVNEEGERFLGYCFDEATAEIVIENRKAFCDRMKKILLELYNPDSEFFKSAQYPAKNRVLFFGSIETGFLSTKDYQQSEKRNRQDLEKNGQNLFGEELSNVQGEEGKPERSDKKPSGLFLPTVVPYKLGNRSLQKLYEELKDPGILNFPNAAHDLLRSFLECSLIAYLKHDSIKKYDDALKEKKSTQKNLTLTKILDYIACEKNSPIQDGSVRSIAKQLISDDQKEYSVERMDMVNHNENWFSTNDNVKKAWMKMEPLFKIILNPKKQK